MDSNGSTSAGSAVEVRISYADFAQLYGGDWSDRLIVRAYPACHVTTPTADGCDVFVEIPAVNDPSTQTLTFTTGDISADATDPWTADASTPTTDPSADPSAGPSASPSSGPSGDPSSAASATASPALARRSQHTGAAPAVYMGGSSSARVVPVASSGSGGGTVYSVSASASNYGSTDLGASTGWQVGEGSGDFSYSYDFDLPAGIGGDLPSLSLGYSSQSVDGMSLAENSQASPAGLGWDLTSGYISRSFASCADDGQSGKGDLCWKTAGNGTVQDELTLVLNGHSTPLIQIGTSNSYRLQDDPGWRVTRSDDTAPLHETSGGVSDTPSNSAWRNEAFKVDAPDGTTYWFGWGHGTSSTLTVPVYGNNPGEPCYSSTANAVDRYCAQGWKFLLDRTLSPGGNTNGHLRTTYTYQRETNYYSRWASTANSTKYDRGAVLSAIDYGYSGRDSGVSRVHLDLNTVNRCVALLTTPAADCALGGTSGPRAKPNQWPDVPGDLVCFDTTTTCSNYSPSFFSTLRYDSIVARVNDAGTMRTVDTYDLLYTMPDPDGTGPDQPDLWLNGIKRTGTGSGGDTLARAWVNFDGTALANRVTVPSGGQDLAKFRINNIRTELGSRIQVTYGHGTTACTPSYVDGLNRWASDRECYAQWYAPPNQTAHWEWFHKYVVTRVVLGDNTLNLTQGMATGAGTAKLGKLRVYDYEYVGTPAWRYVNSPLVPMNRESWDDWRGYSITKVHTRSVSDGQVVGSAADDVSVHRTVRFRGMDGSLARPYTDPSQKQLNSVQLDTREFANSSDEPRDAAALEGRVAEEETDDATGAMLTRTYHAYGFWTTATDTYGIDAHLVYPDHTIEHTATATNGIRSHAIYYTVDDGGTDHRGVKAGMIEKVSDLGDTATGGDQSCTYTDYANDTDRWMAITARVRIYSKSCSTITNPDTDTSLIGQIDTYVDHNGITGSPQAQDPITGWPTAVVHYASATKTTTTRADYDSWGRPISTTDANTSRANAATQASNVTSTITYDGVQNGLLPSTVTVTNAQGQSTTYNLEVRRQNPVSVTDANNHTTQLTYDPLGRLASVTYSDNPSKGQTSVTPNISYTYNDYDNNNPAPSSVKTSVLRAFPNNVPVIDTSYAFSDGWGRVIETQTRHNTTDATLVTATSYDEQGAVRQNIGAFPAVKADNSTWPYGTFDNITDLSPFPQRTQTTYDPLGRVATVKKYGANDTIAWSTLTNTYDGDHTITTVGGNLAGIGSTLGARDTWTDVDGRTTRIDAYATPTATGQAADIGARTTYAYDTLGRLTAITANLTNPTDTTTAAAKTWTYGYDWLGRKTTATDPDTGTSSYTYDDNGNPLTTTDAKNQVVATTYDSLNRPLTRTATPAPSGGTTPPASTVAEWSYDGKDTNNNPISGLANPIGHLATTVSHTDLGDFTTTATGYTVQGDPTGSQFTWPASLSGVTSTTKLTATETYTYDVAGDPTIRDYQPIANLTGTLPDTKVGYTYTTNNAAPAGVTSTLTPLPGSTSTADQAATTLATYGYSAYDRINAISSSAATDSSTGTAGLDRTYTWDNTTGYLTALMAADPATGSGSTANGVTFSRYDYKYDPQGNPRRIKATTQDPTATGTGPANTGAWCYTYDGLNRLTTVIDAAPNATDPSACNPLTATDPAVQAATGTDPYRFDYTFTTDHINSVSGYTVDPTTGTASPTSKVDYAYSDPSHPHALTATTQTGSSSPLPGMPGIATNTYDAAGNIITTTPGAGSTAPRITSTYDAQNQLTATTPVGADGTPATGTGIKTINAYDTAGVRVARITTPVTAGAAGTSTTTIYAGDTEITYKTGDTTASTRRTLTDLNGTPLAVQKTAPSSSTATYTWVLADPQGSIRLTRSTNGGPNSVNRLNSYAYGQPVNTNTNPVGERGWLNKPLDPDGTIRLDHRTFNPTQQVLTNPDPLLNPTDPLGLNPYAYADNNPITGIDPSGLSQIDAFGSGGTTGAAPHPAPSVPATPAPAPASSGGLWGNLTSAASSVVSATASAASTAGNFVVEHKALIASVTVETVTFIGCTAATEGAGAVGCGALAGAAGSAVYNALDDNGDHTLTGTLKAAGIGALLGGAGAGLGEAIAPQADAAITCFISKRATTEAAANAADEAGALVRYDPEFASRNLLGQVGEGYARTPSGYTVSAHAAERIVSGAPGRSPTTLSRVDDILNNPTSSAMRPNGSIRMFQGKDWVAVRGSGPIHIITVMVR